MITHRIAAALAGLLLVPVTTASAATVDVGFACRVDAQVAVNLRLHETIDAQAPTQVRAGATFAVVVTASPTALPSGLSEVRDVALRFRIPDTATYLGASVEGGFGFGSGAYVERVGAVVTVKVRGPIVAGVSYQLPRLTIWLRAGLSGTIEGRLYGSGYNDPALSMTAVIKTPLGGLSARAGCYADPSPVLTRTTITT